MSDIPRIKPEIDPFSFIARENPGLLLDELITKFRERFPKGSITGHPNNIKKIVDLFPVKIEDSKLNYHFESPLGLKLFSDARLPEKFSVLVDFEGKVTVFEHGEEEISGSTD